MYIDYILKRGIIYQVFSCRKNCRVDICKDSTQLKLFDQLGYNFSPFLEWEVDPIKLSNHQLSELRELVFQRWGVHSFFQIAKIELGHRWISWLQFLTQSGALVDVATMERALFGYFFSNIALAKNFSNFGGCLRNRWVLKSPVN